MLDSEAIMITVPFFHCDIFVSTIAVVITIVAIITVINDRIGGIDWIWCGVILRVATAQIDIHVNFGRSRRGGSSCK